MNAPLSGIDVGGIGIEQGLKDQSQGKLPEELLWVPIPRWGTAAAAQAVSAVMGYLSAGSGNACTVGVKHQAVDGTAFDYPRPR